jgi:hypothetical protein
MRLHFRLAAGAALAVLAIAAASAAQDVQSGITTMPGVRVALTASGESMSAPAAAVLKALLDQRKLEALAARDPDQPGRYVAVLYIPGSQLLAVSSPYPVPIALDKRIADAGYMDVYLDLQSTASHAGQFFVMDLDANGLARVCERDQPFDSTTRDGGAPVSFDGNWSAQNLTERDYNLRFAQDDARYAHILQVLAASLSPNAPIGTRKGTE